MDEALTRSEYHKLMSYFEDNTGRKHWLRNALLMRLGFECGLKISDIRLLKVSNFNGNLDTINATRIGNSNSTISLISNSTADLLRRYIKEKSLKRNQYIFISQKSTVISATQIHMIFKDASKGVRLPILKSHYQTLKYTNKKVIEDLGLGKNAIRTQLGYKKIIGSCEDPDISQEEIIEFLMHYKKTDNNYFENLIKYKAD